MVDWRLFINSNECFIITVGTVSYNSFEMLSSYFISKSEICTQCPFVFVFCTFAVTLFDGTYT